MKMGIRTPSIKKSFKAKTTGKLNRAVKKSVNPLYGKKGIGLISNPKKAVYNKVYNKTTIDARDVIASSSKNKNHEYQPVYENTPKKKPSKALCIIMFILSVILIAMSLLLILVFPVGGIIGIIIGIVLLVSAVKNMSKK